MDPKQAIRLAGIVGLVLAVFGFPTQVPERAARGETSPALVRLGEALFFEQALSTNKAVSCATCHIPEHSFTDQKRFSIGQNGKELRRNTPTLINRPELGFEFWDGRAVSLAGQVIHPLETPDEMGHSIGEATDRLRALSRYPPLFTEAFGDSKITPLRLTIAIAAYVTTLRTFESDYDRLRKSGASSSSILNGEKLFQGKARCALCHTGPNFSDERFHNTGVAWRSQSSDAGRGALTGRKEDLRAFKTPTLRELVRTAPYMHDGSMATLNDVVDFYIKGSSPPDPNLDPMLRPIRLRPSEVRDLVAFLRSLSSAAAPPFRTPYTPVR
jgi:cytochrome c peroxidase